MIMPTTELHGDGNDGITAVTAVLGLDFMMDTAVIAGMGSAFTVVARYSGDGTYGRCG